MLRDGQGGDADAGRAFAAVSEALTLKGPNQSKCLFILGDMHRLGDGVDQDLEQAQACFEEVLALPEKKKKDVAIASQRLFSFAQAHASGDGTQKNEAKAREMVEKI